MALPDMSDMDMLRTLHMATALSPVVLLSGDVVNRVSAQGSAAKRASLQSITAVSSLAMSQ